MLLHRRIYQFFIIYCLAVGALLLLKYTLALSDYVIPGPRTLWLTAMETVGQYFKDVMDTLLVAVIGQFISIVLALVLGIFGRSSTWFGSFIKAAAYNIQAYPIVAIAPIIFILLGDGLISRLLIAAMICYFPLLLSVIGIMSEPVVDVEHFYRVTHRMRWQLEVKIRAFENLSQLTTVIAGSATLAIAGTIVAEFIVADAGIGYAIRIALFQSDLPKILVALFLIGMTLSIYQGILEVAGFLIKSAWTQKK